MVGQRVGAACSPDKVGSSRSRLQRGAGVPVRWGAGFTEESVGRDTLCYLAAYEAAFTSPYINIKEPFDKV